MQPLTITEASIRPQPTQYGQEKPHIQGSLPPAYTSPLASVSRTQRAGGRPPGMLNVHQHHQQHYCDSAVASLDSSKDFPPPPPQLVGAAHYVGGNNSTTTQVHTVRSITGGAPLTQSTASSFSNGAPLRATAGGNSSHFFHSSVNYEYGELQRCKGSPVERIVPIQVQKSNSGTSSQQPSTASVSTNTTPEGCQFPPLQQERVPKLTNSAQDASVSHIQPDVRLTESGEDKITNVSLQTGQDTPSSSEAIDCLGDPRMSVCCLIVVCLLRVCVLCLLFVSVSESMLKCCLVWKKGVGDVCDEVLVHISEIKFRVKKTKEPKVSINFFKRNNF